MTYPDAFLAILQLRATARITLAPLVDTLPCLGAVTITLLEEPYIDLSLALIGALDLMQLPGIRDAALFAAKTVRCALGCACGTSPGLLLNVRSGRPGPFACPGFKWYPCLHR